MMSNEANPRRTEEWKTNPVLSPRKKKKETKNQLNINQNNKKKNIRLFLSIFFVFVFYIFNPIDDTSNCSFNVCYYLGS